MMPPSLGMASHFQEPKPLLCNRRWLKARRLRAAAEQALPEARLCGKPLGRNHSKPRMQVSPGSQPEEQVGGESQPEIQPHHELPARLIGWSLGQHAKLNKEHGQK